MFTALQPLSKNKYESMDELLADLKVGDIAEFSLSDD
jgi:hypothetical protein